MSYHLPLHVYDLTLMLESEGDGDGVTVMQDGCQTRNQCFRQSFNICKRDNTGYFYQGVKTCSSNMFRLC